MANPNEIREVLEKIKVGQSFVIEGYRLKTVRRIAEQLDIAVRCHALDKERTKARVYRIEDNPKPKPTN